MRLTDWANGVSYESYRFNEALCFYWLMIDHQTEVSAQEYWALATGSVHSASRDQVKKPVGWEPPFVICEGCGTYYPDMGNNVKCEDPTCGERLPTGRAHWVNAEGDPYPDDWAEFELAQS